MGYDLIWLENACILATGEKQLTVVSPLNRQSAARWLRRMKSQQKAELSPYLAAVAATAADAEVTVAIDLENVFRPGRSGLRQSSAAICSKGLMEIRR